MDDIAPPWMQNCDNLTPLRWVIGYGLHNVRMGSG